MKRDQNVSLPQLQSFDDMMMRSALHRPIGQVGDFIGLVHLNNSPHFAPTRHIIRTPCLPVLSNV